MNLLIIFDGPILKDENGNYYDNCFTNEVFHRYQLLCQNIVFAVRVKDYNNIISNRNSKIEVDHLTIHQLPNISTMQGMLFQRNLAVREIKNLIAEADMVIIRLPSFLGYFAVKYAMELGKPYMVEVVACPWDTFWNRNLQGKLIAPICFFITKKCVKDAPFALYVTKNFLQHRYPNKHENISCSNVVITDTESQILEKRIKKIDILKNNDKVILASVGAANVKYKGQHFVIRALSKLSKKGFKFEYHIVGGGDDTFLRSVAKKYGVEKSVIFCGAIPHDKIFKFLDDVDIYIQPSLQEGLPRALIEAMSRGCLALGSNAGGIPELLDRKFILKKRCVKGIVKILESITTKNLEVQAVINFEKAKSYDYIVLNKIRKSFYSLFDEYSRKF